MNEIVIELIASVYAIIIGIAMLCMWSLLLMKRKISVLKIKPTNTYFHIIAEFLTSIILIVGWIGLIIGQFWEVAVYFIANGMVIYSTINAAGFYGQLKDWPMFITLLVFTFISLLITSLIFIFEF